MEKEWWTARVRKEDVLQRVEEGMDVLTPREGELDRTHLA